MTLSLTTLSTTTLCHYADCRYAECCGAVLACFVTAVNYDRNFLLYYILGRDMVESTKIIAERQFYKAVVSNNSKPTPFATNHFCALL
jgi:hypothetical protein